MGTKTITIMDDAYELLKQEKTNKESFSDVIRKVIPKKKSIWDFVGAWKDVSDEEADKLHKTLEEIRNKENVLRRQRINELMRSM